MLFNSYIFIFLFLPVTVVVFHTLRHIGRWRTAISALILASLVFYAWWSVEYLFLLLGLLCLNFLIARQIQHWRSLSAGMAKAFLILGVMTNLGVLAYYKYANFFIDNINTVFGLDISLAAIMLPLGISFFIFQKLAFLIDTWQGKVNKLNFLDYVLFVMFFPQLIAGPIVHHSEIIPQFAHPGRFMLRDMAIGITIFVLGLSKKVLLADTSAQFSSPVFSAVQSGAHPDFLSAWGAALAYTAQIYYDFSGYSDMAIGIGLMFGIRLPVNFDSPYKSFNIIEFWRRWHITLSRFLRDYLYIPLGGNRKGEARRYANLYITMLLGGIWHGAGWTYLVWGALHGIYLIVNHGWQSFGTRFFSDKFRSARFFRLFSWLITFLAVVVAWVFFRAGNFGTAVDMLCGMAGCYGLNGSEDESLIGRMQNLCIPFAILLMAFFLPNVQKITGYRGPEGAYGSYAPERSSPALHWKMSTPWALCIGALLALCLMRLSNISEFIYFQF